MRSRLRWRLLVVPRLVLALGVIVWALLHTLFRGRRRLPQPVRLAPMSDDPVSEAIADARPVRQAWGDEPDPDDLRWIVTVNEQDVADDEGGFNTVVGLDDEVWSYADVYADGLEDALADQPGIDAVAHVDREVLLVRTMLSLADVHAATILALLAINRNPRRTPPRFRSLHPAMVSALADDVADVLAGYGFVGRLRMSPDHDDMELNPRCGPGFYRVLSEERLVQVVVLRDGVGHHNDDGTVADARLGLCFEVVEIGSTDAVVSVECPYGCETVAGERIVSASYDRVRATLDGVRHSFLSDVVPVSASTMTRAAIVDRWVGGLPWYVPDRPRWEAADTAARWGFRKHARDLLKHGRRRLPQAAAVAAKHGL